jgi:hypothetical protein
LTNPCRVRMFDLLSCCCNPVMSCMLTIWSITCCRRRHVCDVFTLVMDSTLLHPYLASRWVTKFKSF